MKRRIWILTAIICLAVCLAGVCLCGAFAEQPTLTAKGSGEYTVRFRVDPEAAEEAYIRQLFGLPVTPVDELPKMRGSTGGDLLGDGTPEKGLYSALKARALQVANGQQTSTVFVFEDTDYLPMISFIDEDLGCDAGEQPWYVGDDGYGHFYPEGDAILTERVNLLLDKAFNAVMFDCPYEMFWMNKGGDSYYASWNYSLGYADGHYNVTLATLTMQVVVSGSYRDENAADYGFVTDGTKIGTMVSAAENAQAIVDENAALSDMGKLEAYKDAICDLTEYNTPAAHDQFEYDYGDPWQLVWVFDGDDSTTVVCEGYSKAFMYLCDLTEEANGWNSNVTAICVSGTMATWDDGKLDDGPHMWNIVSIDGVNYLADVTNSDAGTYGYNGGLFMDGYDQKDGSGRTYVYDTAGGQVIYTYDKGTVRTFAASGKLNLAGAGTVTLMCDKDVDGEGRISMPLYDRIEFSVTADPSIRDSIQNVKLMIGDREKFPSPFELVSRGHVEYDWVPIDELAADMAYTVVAKVLVGEGDNGTWITSAPITVHVLITDEITEDPEFQTDEQPVEVPLDRMLNIYVGPNNVGADYYGCFIEENGKWIADSHWVAADPDNGEAEVRMPVFGCTVGESYEAHFYSIKLGAPMRVAQETVQVTVTERERIHDPIMLVVQDIEDDENPDERICRFETDERVRIFARYENPDQMDEETSWIKVRVYEKSRPDNVVWDDDGDGFYYWTDGLRIDRAGTYIVQAEIMQIVNNDWGNAATVEGTRTLREIEVTAPGGSLGTPRAVVPYVVRDDDDFTIRFFIDGDGLIDRYSFKITPDYGNEWLAGGEIRKDQYNIDDLYRDDVQDWVYDFTVPAGTLEGNRAYQIYLYTYARGYNRGSSNSLLLVTGEPEEDENVISATGPAQIRFSEEFTIRMEAPGAQFTRVQCGATGEYLFEYSAYSNNRFCIDSDPGGEACRFSVIAMYEDGTIRVAPDLVIPYDRGEPGSEIPAAGAPTLAVDEAQDAENIPHGHFIRAIVGEVEDAEEYVVMIRDGGTDKYVQTVTSATAGTVLVPTSNLRTGHTYYMVAYARVPGKVRTLSEEVEIGLNDATAEDAGLYVNKTTLEAGEMLQFSIVAPGADDVQYCFSTEYEGEYYENEWQSAWNWNGESHLGGQSWDGAANVKLKAKALYEGNWVQIGSEISIRFTSRGELDEPTFSLPNTLQEGEDYTLTIQGVDHADSYWLYVYRYDDEGWNLSARPGENTIPGYMLYGGGYNISVSVSGYGYDGAYCGRETFVKPREPHMVIPYLTMDNTQAFNITVDLIPGATHYCLEIHDAANGSETLILNEEAAYQENGLVTFTVPAGMLTDGMRYRVDCYVTSTDPKFHSCSATKTILCWSGDMDSGVTITLDPNESYLPINQEIEVTVNAPETATAVIIRFGDQSYGFAGNTAEWTVSSGKPGEVVLYAQACYETNAALPDDPGDPAWDDLTWGYPSFNPRRLTFAVNGQTGMPYFKMPETVAQGDVLVITVYYPGDGADEVHANINWGTPENEAGWVYEYGWHSWNENTQQIMMATSMLEPGEYWVAVDNSGVGKMGNRNWDSFVVTARNDLEEGEILLTVPEEVDDGELLPVSVYAPGAVRVGFCIDPEDWHDPDAYAQMNGEIIYNLTGIRLSGAGTHHVYACAQFTEGGEWQFTSKAVEVARQADEGIEIYPDREWDGRNVHLLLHEDINFSVYTDYEGYDVELVYGDQTETKTANEDGDAYFQRHCGEEGTFKVYARIWIEDEPGYADEGYEDEGFEDEGFDDGDYDDEGVTGEGDEGEGAGDEAENGHWVFSNQITVHVDLLDPMPVFEPLAYTVTGSTENIPQDGVLDIEVTNLAIGADFYGAYVTDGESGEWICDTHWVSQEWAAGKTLLHLPLLQCEPGEEHDYRVHVYAIKYGVPMFEAANTTGITVAGAEQGGKILISMDDSFVVSAPVCFYACYTDAYLLPKNIKMRVTVHSEDDENDIWYDESKDPADFWENDLRIGMRGTYVLKAEVRGWDEEEGEEGSTYTATRTFEMVTDPADHDLEAEFVTPVKSLMTREEAKNFTFSYTAVNAQHTSVELFRIDDEYGDYPYGRAEASLWYEETDDEDVRIPHALDMGGPAHFTVSENGVMTCTFESWDVLEEGEYEIRICTDAWNWQTATLNARFRIGGPIFTVYENGVKRTVNDTTLSGSYYYKIYIEGMDGDEWLELRSDPAGIRQDGYVQYMPHDARGTFILALPPDEETDACTLTGEYYREDGDSHTEEVDLEFELGNVTSCDDVLLEFTEENTPVLMQPCTLTWTAVPGAEAYIVHWVTPDGRRDDRICASNSLEINENNGLHNMLGIPGEYTVSITAYANGCAYDYAADTFTAAAVDTLDGEVTFTPAPSETPIGIARNGYLQIAVDNIGADYYGAYAVNANVQNGGRILETDWVNEETNGDTTTLTLFLADAESELQAGDRLTVYVYAVKYGYGIKEAQGTLTILITDEVLPGADIRLALTQGADGVYQVPAYQDFGVSMYLPDADCVELYVDGRYKTAWYNERLVSDTLEVAPGTHELRFDALYDYDVIGSATFLVTGTVDEEDPETGIYANVDSVIWMSGETTDEPFEFMVANLYRAENEYWRIELKDEYGDGLWSEGSESGSSVAQPTGEGEDEEVDQYFTIPGNTFEDRNIYFLTIEAHVIGKMTFRHVYPIKAVGYDNEYNDHAITLRVNGQDEEAEGQAGEDAYLSIEAPGAVALRLYHPQPGDSWEYLEDYDGNGYFERREKFSEGERIYYAEARYDDDGDWTDWISGSNTVTAYGRTSGQTREPVVTLEGGTVDDDGILNFTRGDILTVVIDAPEDGYEANRFGVRIVNENGMDESGWTWVEDVTSFPVKVGFNTSRLEAETMFTVQVEACAPGKTATDKWDNGYFTVNESGAGNKPTIRLMKDPDNDGVYHVLQGEHVQVLGTAPNADRVYIIAHNVLDTDGEHEINEYNTVLFREFYYDDYEGKDPAKNCYERFGNVFGDLGPGTYEIFAEAVFDDPESESGEYRVQSDERLTVCVEMQDRTLLKPEILLNTESAAVNPYEDLAFSVTNLLQPGVNNWSVIVYEESGYGEAFCRTNNSYPAIDNDGNVAFTVPMGTLGNGRRYIIKAWLCGIGYESQEAKVQILTADDLTDEPRIEITVDRTDVLVKEEISITIRDTADPEDDPSEITAILLNRGNECWEQITLEDGVYECTNWFSEPGARVVSVKYTTEDPDEEWDSLNWEHSAVRINVTALGTLPKPVGVLDKTTGILQGDVLKLTMTDPAEPAGAEFGYYANVERAEQRDWGWDWDGTEWHYDADGRSGMILIPTMDMAPGKYRLNVGMHTVGYTDSHTYIDFRIDRSGEEPVFQFVTGKTDLQTGEETALYLYAENADEVKVEITKADDDNWRDQRYEGAQEGHWSWSAADTGTYYLKPIACFEDGTTRTTDEPVTVTVTAPEGTIAIKSITAPNTLALGSSLQVTVEAELTDADGETTVPAAGARLHVHLADVSGDEGYDVDKREINLDEYGRGTVTFPYDAEKIWLGGVYSVNADVQKKGWETGYAEKRLTVVPAEPDTEHTVTLTVDGLTTPSIEVPSSRQMHVRVEAPGATAVRVLNDNQWEYAAAESMDYEWGYGDGDKIIVAMATYDEWAGNFYDMNWTGLSNTITVHILNAGVLGEPNFELSSDTPVRGDVLVAQIGPDPELPEGAPANLHTWYYANMAKARVDDDGKIYNWDYHFDWNWIQDEQNRRILIPTAKLEAGTYKLIIGIDAEGWMSTQKETLFTLADVAAGTFATDLEDNATIPLNCTTGYAVMLRGADAIYGTYLKRNEVTGSYEPCWENNEIQLTDRDSGTIMLSFSNEGHYRIIFHGTVNGEEIAVTKDFTVISYGTLDAPKIRMNGVWTSGGLQFTVMTDEPDTELEVEVRDWEGMEECVRTFDHNFSFSADLFETGKDYTVSIYHNKEGFYPYSSQFRVRRIAADKTMTLPAALQEIENEAFAGIAAELVIIPGNTTTIGENAFDGSQLKAIFIPDNVTSIHPYAFGDIYQLTVYGHEGSYAESFANEKGFDFIAVN